MFVRHADYEWELIRWLIVLGLATALMLSFASSLAAVEIKAAGEPELLLLAATSVAVPMPSAELTPQASTASDSLTPIDIGRQVWLALELQQAGRYPEAINAWGNITLDCDGEVWKWAALGHAYMVWGEFEQAEEALQRALDMDPENGVVHYFRGLLQLEKSHWAGEWQDANVPQSVRLVKHFAPFIERTRSRLELDAIVSLEAAVEHGSAVRLEQSLLPLGMSTAAAVEPTVHDVLFATGADQFVARTHNLLGALKMEGGFYEAAERHLDAAELGGQSAWLGYRDLGKQYEAEGRHLDAFRVHVKAMESGNGVAGPAADAWQSLRNACHDMWLGP